VDVQTESRPRVLCAVDRWTKSTLNRHVVVSGHRSTGEQRRRVNELNSDAGCTTTLPCRDGRRRRSQGTDTRTLRPPSSVLRRRPRHRRVVATVVRSRATSSTTPTEARRPRRRPAAAVAVAAVAAARVRCCRTCCGCMRVLLYFSSIIWGPPFRVNLLS